MCSYRLIEALHFAFSACVYLCEPQLEQIVQAHHVNRLNNIVNIISLELLFRIRIPIKTSSRIVAMQKLSRSASAAEARRCGGCR